MKATDQAPDKAFVHRRLANGMIESFCMTCFLTICRCKTAKEVEEAESDHTCQDNPVPAPFLFR
jgi:hypothetical protein